MKFLLALFSFLLFSLLPFRSFSVGGPAHAQTDLDCAAVDVVKIMDAATCQTIKDLFSKNSNVGPWYNQSPTQFAEKVFSDKNSDEIFGERYTYAQINWIVNSIAAMLNPAFNITNPSQLFDFLNSIKKVTEMSRIGEQPTFSDYAKLGPAGLFIGGISALYSNPPASGIQEIKYTASKIFDYTTGTEPAYAQGYGFSGLNSGGAVRALWTASRNMAYLIMTILLIASGFLIMFRVKINPQTVVSLQTMIPKLIITIILVTFSFAIAGLVIDLVYVIIAAFVGMLSLGGIITSPASVGNTISVLTANNFGVYLALQFGFILLALLVGVVVGIVIFTTLTGLTGGVGAIPAGIISVLVGIGIFVWILLTLFKVFLMLIKTYITLVLLICIGPLQIMLDLVPGQQGFGPWIRNIIANASVFVVVPIMVVIQTLFSGSIFANSILNLQTFSWLGGVNFGLPFFGGSTLTSWNLITFWFIGLFILSLTPKVADMVRDALKIPAFKYGTAFGEAMAPIRQLAGMGAQELGMRGLSKVQSQKQGPIVIWDPTHRRWIATQEGEALVQGISQLGGMISGNKRG